MAERSIAINMRALDLRSGKTNAQAARHQHVEARRKAVAAFAETRAAAGSPVAVTNIGMTSPGAPRAMAARAIALAQHAAGYSDASAARASADAANSRAAALEATLEAITRAFGEQLLAGPGDVPGSIYCVKFPAGLIGIVLSQAPDGNLVVEEMKEGLLAKTSGLVNVGDVVLSINDRLLARAGPPTLTNALEEMKAAPRPVRILFQRARTPV